MFILKVDSGMAGALAEFFALRILLDAISAGNVGGKGVRWQAGYFMGYYTIWLFAVKRIFVPFWEYRIKRDVIKMVGGEAPQSSVHVAQIPGFLPILPMIICPRMPSG